MRTSNLDFCIVLWALLVFVTCANSRVEKKGDEWTEPIERELFHPCTRTHADGGSWMLTLVVGRRQPRRGVVAAFAGGGLSSDAHVAFVKFLGYFNALCGRGKANSDHRVTSRQGVESVGRSGTRAG